MLTIEEIKIEIAKESGEVHGFDFLVQCECEIGSYEAVRTLYSNLIERYINQYEINKL